MTLTRMVGGQPVQFATHQPPLHLDEVAALWLFEGFATVAQVGLIQSQFPDGIIGLGIGDGPFNEHGRKGKGRDSQRCTALRVAKALGLEGDRALMAVLGFVNEVDNARNRYRIDLGNQLQAWQQEHPDLLAEIITRFGEELIISYHDRQRFFQAVDKLQGTNNSHRVVIPSSADPTKQIECLVVWAEVGDDDTHLHQAAFDKQLGLSASVLVLRGKEGDLKGNVQILFDGSLDLPHDVERDLIRILRYQEMKKTGQVSKSKASFKELEDEGLQFGWYRQGRLILNGSRSHPEVPATVLSLPEIMGWALVALQPSQFYPDHQAECLAGVCVGRCQWYPLGLLRCRRIRFAKREQASRAAGPTT